MEIVKENRKEYELMKEKHTVDPNKQTNEEELHLFNPLSTEEESPWTAFWENKALQKTIQQDLERTHPENPYFQLSYVQDIMLRILFVYSKEHTDTSYRQGMHEILALIIHLIDNSKKDAK